MSDTSKLTDDQKAIVKSVVTFIFLKAAIAVFIARTAKWSRSL